jgi:osmoprotectant transport system ATP-binding protein
VATVPRLLGWSRERIRNRVAEVLDLVGLPESRFGSRMPAELSGGQRQRVGVARGLASDPDLLLMDEPFGALDPGTREAIQEEFLNLNARLRKTVVLVTHDMAEAGRLADEIVLLDHGRVVQQGSLRDLLLRPAGDAVRSFLGRRAQWLALEVLRLNQVVGELPTMPPSAQALRLPGELSLGQALVKLADLDESASVVMNGHGYLARSLRARILADLEAVSPGD